MVLLEVVGAGKKEKENFTVKDINFSQQPLEKIAIAGETGSGKTTLLKMIGGLAQLDEGNIYYDGKRVLGPLERLIPGHPQIAYLSQHFELRNNYRVEEELESKNLLTQEAANNIYRICRIEHLLKRKTDQLSGGERQRIVLARLLTTSPKLLLLDEPFSNLDAIHKNIIKSVLLDIGTQLNTSCILVSHDAADTLSWADSIYVLKEGVIVQQGSPQKIYNEPINEYCAGLFGEYNLLNAANAKQFFPNANDKEQLIVRPEQFSIVIEGSNTVKGIVQAVYFFGSCYVVDVLVNGQLLRVRTEEKDLVIGDEIFLVLRIH
ncbi:MAG: ABC transporter ATP-binding protein [Chitinophagaceae bacterium]|nr:ABC transporter ATP-binding protein [Chitinophagaceae bacterium]MBK8606026.1 ABC transporter ATP-binding protein [Chitinophagaceae bacterium]MBP6476820.1 ABC transporter ATP-binding protein [Chitinophagaceae bacterium]MBP7107042.1 ABC transporter ATP-binding protein [Chitinophagaceae bacterium]MBP7313978.1 ABC transporter ATP-binding protein [Chitinophagaceae bacterium]